MAEIRRDHMSDNLLPMWRLALLLLAACGRLGFDTPTDALTGDMAGVGMFAPARQTYIKASNPEVDDYFGMTVALSADGSTLAIAAPHEDSGAAGVNGDQTSNTATNAGAVYIFTHNGSWQQQAYLKASNVDVDDNFGSGLALSADGNTLVIGATAESSRPGNPADNSLTGAGAVYVFVRTGTTWTQQAMVKASNADAGDRFGAAVALSADGNTLAAGAPAEASAATGVGGNQASNTATASGAVYVYRRSGQTWSQEGYIKASNTEANDEFGGAVALSADGNTLAAGALGEDSAATGVNGDGTDNSAKISGAAYVYTRAGTTWSFQAYFKASNTGASDRFGTDVSLSGDGNLLAVGAPSESSSATGVGGDQTNNGAGLSGAAYLFSRANATWRQSAYVKASNTGSGDFFGERVALTADGATLAVSAIEEASGNPADPSDDSASGAGAVYVFAFTQTWAQIAYIKAPHPDAIDNFGYGLAVCPTAVAAGAFNESSAATGINGEAADNNSRSSGAAYIFGR